MPGSSAHGISQARVLEWEVQLYLTSGAEKVEEEDVQWLDLQEEAGSSDLKKDTDSRFYFTMFVSLPDVLLTARNAISNSSAVEVRSIFLIEAGKWHKFGLKQWDHCEHLYHITSILGDSADTNEEKEEAPEPL